MARSPQSFTQYFRSHAAASTILLAALTLFATTVTRADGLEAVVRYGQSDGDYERVGAGLRFGSWWATDWGNWKVTLRPELEVSHFRYTGPVAGPDSMNQIGGIGLARFQYGEGNWRPYAEVGLGVSLFSRDTLGNKEFSTHFQFSEHLGLGVMFTDSVFAGWQYSHYSNADIDEPNDGIDMHQAVIGMRF